MKGNQGYRDVAARKGLATMVVALIYVSGTDWEVPGPQHSQFHDVQCIRLVTVGLLLPYFLAYFGR